MTRRAAAKIDDAPHPIWGRDPAKYDGPLRRMDGTRPFNNYFWPTTRYTLRAWNERLANTLIHRMSRDAIGVCQLNTGQWINTDDGSAVYKSCPRYPTREAALTACAQNVLKAARYALTSPPNYFGTKTAISSESYAGVVLWVAWVLATDKAARDAEAGV